MRLISDFVNDWLNILRDILSNYWGYDTSGIDNEDLPLLYFNAEKRRPDARPRSVKESDAFRCPPDLHQGWENLRHLVVSGADLTAHLSKLVGKLNNKDSMLNDWGVHHFHLGATMEGDYIKRTGPLLFAMITEKYFYAIGVYQHGSWADADIVETLHRNWPEVIQKYEIENTLSIDRDRSQSERMALRKKNINSFVTVADGTVYGPLGGGMLSNGYNLQARTQTDRQIAYLQELEKALELRLPTVKEELAKHGYAGQSEVEAKLEITESQYIANFPEFGVAVELVSKA